MSSHIDEHRHAFDRLVELGNEPARAGQTFEFHCVACDVRNWLPLLGGVFPNPGRCEPRCSPRDIHTYVMLAGERWTLGTLYTMTGSDKVWDPAVGESVSVPSAA